MYRTWNKKEWLKKKPRIGTYIQISDSAIVEVLGKAGFEFLVFDCEHGPLGVENLKTLVMASHVTQTVPIVRVQNNDPQLIMAPLDLGALGIQVPNINSSEETLRAVRACRYHPAGRRGSNPYVRANNYGIGDFKNCMSFANDNILLVIQVEGVEGVDNLSQILEIPGVDIVWLGPYDLSQSMGIPGQVEHPMLLEKMEIIVTGCRKQGVAVGTFASSPGLARKWISAGVDLVAVSYDTKLLYDGAKLALDQISS